jgi:signal transduction histidine kinase
LPAVSEYDRERRQLAGSEDHLLANHEIISTLLEHFRLERERLAWWCALRDACVAATRATTGQIFLYESRKRRLREIEWATSSKVGRPLRLGPSMPATSEHIAARATRMRAVADCAGPDDSYELAIAIQRPAAEGGISDPLAVLVLHYTRLPERLRAAIRLKLNELLTHIWPLAVYASMRDRQPLAHQVARVRGGVLTPSDVLDQTVSVLRTELRLGRIEISVVDAHGHEIIARAEPAGGSGEETHLPACRVLVSVSAVLTAEALVEYPEKIDPDPVLTSVVERYAQDMALVLEFALLQEGYDSERKHASALADLHRITLHLQTHGVRGEDELLREITRVARNALNASIVMLYPMNRATGRLFEPILAGDVKGSKQLSPPDDDNIVMHISRSATPYYQPDVQNDPVLTTLGASHAGDHTEMGARARTFTQRQDIRSFAGVPLVVGDRSYGVLCINYRAPHDFMPRDKQLIELFAQQASAVVASGELARAEERRRLEQDLHDWVQSDVLGLLFQCRAAMRESSGASDDPALHRLELHLVDIERAAHGILADIGMMLRGVPADAYQGQALERVILEDFRRFLGHSQSKVTLALDAKLPPLPVALARTLLALMREAITNALRHAQAEKIVVRVHNTERQLHLSVEDDGRGFAAAAYASSDQRGQANMLHRVHCNGGTMLVSPAAGGGTRLQITLPLGELEAQ